RRTRFFTAPWRFMTRGCTSWWPAQRGSLEAVPRTQRQVARCRWGCRLFGAHLDSRRPLPNLACTGKRPTSTFFHGDCDMRPHQRWMAPTVGALGILASGAVLVFFARGTAAPDEKISPRPAAADPVLAEEEKAIRATAAAF